MRIALIANSRSKEVKNKNIRPGLENKLLERNIRFELFTTQYHGHAFEMMRQISIGEYDAIGIMGGDGTNYQVLNGLLKYHGDRQLPPLGIRLEDKAGGSVWKLADSAELLLEMEQKQAEAQRKAEEKAKKAAADAKKEALNKLSPADYLKQLTLEDGTTLMYSKFDETGLPTHDHAGESLNKSQAKKVQKLFKAQQSKYDKYMKSQHS